jgi:DNA-binding CsgD family transcriptional regulator
VRRRSSKPEDRPIGKSQRLRLGEVRAVYRLVGECRELGADSLTWRTHLAGEICRLVGAQVGFVGETDGQGMGPITQTVDLGWVSAEARSLWLRYLQELQYASDPIIRCVWLQAVPHGTCLREQIVPDRPWYNSVLFNDYLTAAEIDDAIFSFHPVPEAGRAVCGLVVYRALSDRRYAQRDRRIVELCYGEIGRLEGTLLATARDPSVSRLSPRLRQVLAALLEGDAEKQVGRRLGLRPDTVREYVLAVYRHFGASTRSELLAYFLRRSGLRLPDPGPGGAAESGTQS